MEGKLNRILLKKKKRVKVHLSDKHNRGEFLDKKEEKR